MKIGTKVDKMLKSPENTDLRREVEDEVLRLSYFIPQKEFGLKEEDAGEFVLEMTSVIDEIFELSWNTAYGDSTGRRRKESSWKVRL